MMSLKRIILPIAVLLLAACQRDDNFSFDTYPSSSSVNPGTAGRVETEPTRNVLIVYSAGFNSISSYLSEDLQDLESGQLPYKHNTSDHVLLVYSRLPKRIGYYTEGTESFLYRLYSDDSGKPRKDTLKIWGPEYDASSPEVLESVLDIAKEKFPAKGYGMVLTSHGSGWLPPGYYSDPSKFEGGQDVFSVSKRSIAQDNNPGNSVEFSVNGFADAIPYRLDYLLFDACLCGGVELAYQLRGKADVVGFSQTEILADGFDYKTITTRLLKAEPDPLSVCDDYFQIYNVRSGSQRSATISLVDTRKMGDLADVCKDLFRDYRTQMEEINASRVQGFFRYDRHYFYDLQDILVKAGISEPDQQRLQAALDKCVLYKAHTDVFLTITIRTDCGLSMYLPAKGSAFLDNYYKENIDWNKDTELVL